MRIQYIDKLKCMAIMLVVMGHVAEKSCGIMGEPFNLMYSSFHMPLFMFLSGVFAYKGIKMFSGAEAWMFLRKKALRVLVPFVTIGGIYSLMVFGDFTQIVMRNPGGYWFLPALFIDMIVGLCVVYVSHIIAPHRRLMHSLSTC